MPCVPWAQIFTTWGSHQYYLPNHWFLILLFLSQLFDALFSFSKMKYPALRNVSVVVLSFEPRCPHWQCWSLGEFSQTRHREDQIQELPFHFNVRKDHLSETKHHLQKCSQVRKNCFLTADCSWPRVSAHWTYRVSVTEIGYTLQPQVKIIANRTLGCVTQTASLTTSGTSTISYIYFLFMHLY